MTNKNKLIIFLILIPLLSSCSKEYEVNMQARKEIAWVQSTNQRMATGEVMEVIAKILNPIEEIKREESPATLHDSNKKTPVGDNYAMYLMSEMMGKFIEQQGKAEMMRARAQAIQFLQPIIQSIYSQHMADFGVPMSSNEVWAKLVDTVPLVATVGGMYALGAKGLDAAGDTITNTTASGNSVIGANNTVTHTVTTDTITNLPSSP